MFQWRSPHSLSVVMKLIQHSSRALYIFQVGKIIFSGRLGETANALQTLRTLQQNLRPPTGKVDFVNIFHYINIIYINIIIRGPSFRS